MTRSRTMQAVVAIFAPLALLASLAPTAEATPAFAKKEGKMCNYCHIAPPMRNFRGLYYKKNGHSFADFDNVYEAKAAGVKPESMGPEAAATVADYPSIKVPTALDFTLKDIDGKPVKLARFAGNVIIMVNVASKCGNTPQYATLEKLYEKYQAKGLIVLAFPANNFGGQEPGNEKTIKEFCEATYKVKFPLFSKVSVKGDDTTPLYKYLTSKEANAKIASYNQLPENKLGIDWNFAKFIINRKGEVVNRYKSTQDLLDKTKPEIVAEIEKLLAEKAEDAR